MGRKLVDFNIPALAAPSVLQLVLSAEDALINLIDLVAARVEVSESRLDQGKEVGHNSWRVSVWVGG